MSLANFADANGHLDDDKVKFANQQDASAIALSVDRYVRGRLVGVYGDQVLDWDVDPTVPQVATPELVREIAAMLMAAQLYEEKYSLEANEANFGTRLEKKAEALLDQVAGGQMVLVEIGAISGLAFSQLDFVPNDLTDADIQTRKPKFSMEDVF